VTGFTVRPVKVESRDDNARKPAPDLWELAIMGWGGVAPRDSGISLDPVQSCTACGLLIYTRFSRADRLIDHASLDGSDVFIVWPMPRYYFVTDKVKDIIASEEFTGIAFTEYRDLVYPPGIVGGFNPGRLSYWFPPDVARRIGEPLGID